MERGVFLSQNYINFYFLLGKSGLDTRDMLILDCSNPNDLISLAIMVSVSRGISRDKNIVNC